MSTEDSVGGREQALNSASIPPDMAGKQLAQDVSLLQQTCALLTETLDLDRILPALVEGAMRLTQTQSGVVYILDDTGERFLRSYGYPVEFSHPLPRMSAEGYTRLIVRRRDQIAVDDALTDARASPDLKYLGVKSFVGTPLILEGERVVGVLYVNDTSVRRFTGRELSLLQALADQAAVAVEHARLFEALDHRATQLEQLQAVTTAISAEPSDLSRVLRLIVERLSDVFPGASCAVRLYDPETAEFESQVGTGVLEDLLGRPPRDRGTSHLDTSSEMAIPQVTVGQGRVQYAQTIVLDWVSAQTVSPIQPWPVA